MENELICIPVMLRTRGIVGVWNTLWKNTAGQIMHTHTSEPGHLQPQHLYLTSSREFSYDNWSYSKIHAQVTRWGKHKPPHDSVRIEATTDKSLDLPLIPQSFVERFVEAQGKIDKVGIKMKQYEATFISKGGYKPEITSNQEIIILPIKDSWNREELKQAYEDGVREGVKYKQFSQWETQGWTFKEWFDKNY